jgi:long-chain acyl-CoA synthetase
MQDAENSLATLIRESLNRLPDEGPAMEFSGRWYSWGFVHKLFADLEASLAELAIAEGERIGLIARTRPSHIASLWAIIASRRCASMIYSYQSDDKLAADLRELRLPLIIADRQDWTATLIGAARESGSAGLALSPDGIERVQELASVGARARREPARGIAIETLSSGTTGRPKRISLPVKMVEGSVKGAVAALEQMFGEGEDRFAPIIMMLPLGNMSGIYGVLPPLVKGHPMSVMEKFDVDGWLERMRRHRPPTADIPPAAIAMLLQQNVAAADLASLKVIRSGASPLDRGVQRELLERFRIPVALSYGASEFCGILTTWTSADLAAHAHDKLGSCGRAVPGVQLRIVDAQSGAVIASDAIGLLEAQADRVGDAWIRTSDLCRLDADGFLWFAGRADDAIMRGGFKIVPDQVADVLREHPAIADAAVVGMPDVRLGEVPMAAIELLSSATPPTVEDLFAFARSRLAAYQIPVRFLIVESIPRTPSMKISREETRQLFRN